MKKIIWSLIVIVVIIIIVISLGHKGVTETGPIKIGFIGPLTGDVSALGQASRAGVEVAVD